jgi:hypothetical protein
MNTSRRRVGPKATLEEAALIKVLVIRRDNNLKG